MPSGTRWAKPSPNFDARTLAVSVPVFPACVGHAKGVGHRRPMAAADLSAGADFRATTFLAAFAMASPNCLAERRRCHRLQRPEAVPVAVDGHIDVDVHVSTASALSDDA